MNVEDLYVIPTKAQLVDVLLQNLTAAGCPATDWYPGSKQRTLLEQLESTAALELIGAMVDVAKTNWIDDAKEEWLTDLAHYIFALDRTPGTTAVQNVTLACATGYGPHTLIAGDLLVGADGKIYEANSGGSLSGGGTLSIQATAQTIGPALGNIVRLDVPKAGVTVSSSSIATVSSVKRYGSAKESDASLRARCLARWKDIAAVATRSRYVRWALASTTEITRAKAIASSFPNEVKVTVAGVSGAISGGGLTTATAYMMARRPIGIRLTIQNATTAAIQAGGSVWVPRGTKPIVQAAAQASWASYLGTTVIGGKVVVERLVQFIRNAGALDVRGAVVGNAGGGGLWQYDYQLGSTEVPVLMSGTPNLADQMLWYEV